MIEVVANDRLGKKVRVKCNEDDLVGDLKKLIAAQIGTRPEKIRLQKWHTIFKDHVTLQDYEIHDGEWVEGGGGGRGGGGGGCCPRAHAQPTLATFTHTHSQIHPLCAAGMSLEMYYN